MTGFDAGIGCLLQAGRVAWMLGDSDGAIERVERGVAQARATRHPLMISFALFFDAWLAQYRGDAMHALRAADEAVTIGEQYGYPHVTAWARILRGWAIAEEGLASQGEAMIHTGLEALEAMGIKLIRPQFLALLAEAQAMQGRTADARDTLTAARTVAERTEERGYLPQILALESSLTA
jgi:predicted ATPase